MTGHHRRAARSLCVSDSAAAGAVSVEHAVSAIARASPCVVMLVGPPGAGKSTLASELVQRLGCGTATVSYAAFREEVSGDPYDLAADPQAGALLMQRLKDRCAARHSTVVDGTHHLARTRAALLSRAVDAGLPAVALVLSTPIEVCLARQQDRPPPVRGRQHGQRIPQQQVREIARMIHVALPNLEHEGFIVQVLARAATAPAW